MHSNDSNDSNDFNNSNHSDDPYDSYDSYDSNASAPHPVTTIIDALLHAATSSPPPPPLPPSPHHSSPVPAVILLDDEDDDPNPQPVVTLIPDSPSPSVVPMPLPLSAPIPPPSTVLLSTASTAPAVAAATAVAFNTTNTTTNIDAAATATAVDDDDDDIQIVSSAIVSQPVTQTILVDSDSDDEPAPVPKVQHPRAKPTPASRTPDVAPDAPRPPSPDVVVCAELSPTPTPIRTARRILCAICSSRVRTDRPALSRCKHVLCPACMLLIITAQPPASSTKPSTPVGLDSINTTPNSKTDPSSSEMTLCPLPVCRVSRCGAPLARSEVMTALSPPSAEDFFTESLKVFREWVESPTDDFGSAAIDFPSFDDMEPQTLASVPGGDQPDEVHDALLNDDMQAACAPLWAYDDDIDASPDGTHPKSSRPRGVWVCLACGGFEVATEMAALPHTPSPRTMSPDDTDSAVPDPPSHPHCAYARALSVVENIKGLADLRDGSSSGKSKRKTSRARATTSRKRYRSVATIRAAKRRKTTGFAKGTGYAGKNGVEWRGTSVKMLEQKAKLDQISAFWLSRLRCFLLLPSDAPLNSWPGFMRQLLKEEKLVPHLASILINESIMDVEERVPVFVAALRCVHALCDSPSLRVLVTEPSDGDQGKTIAELVESLSRQAAFLSTGAGPEGLSKHTELLIKQIRRCIRLIYRNNLLAIARGKTGAEITVDVDNEQSPKPDANIPSSSLGVVTSVAIEELNRVDIVKEISFDEDKAEYIAQMKKHQFKAVPGLAKTSFFFQEGTRGDEMGVQRNKRQRRIATEVASLFSSLPLSWSSTILLRVDEDRYDFLRAVIFGPEDSPYDSGAFVFDIYLPMEYPNVPPKFQLLTTGAGRVRFNPNLYDTGKVCLSLLGTWSGPSWNSSSTILQVLVSIQSLILVSDPYFNEPGYEKQMGTERGKQQSTRYNERVRQDCAFYAIQYNIRNPYPDLRDGLLTHFRLKRRYLKHLLPKWFPHAATTRDGSQSMTTSTVASNGVSVSMDPSMPTFAAVFGAGSVTTAMSHLLNPMSSGMQLSTFEPGRNFRNYSMTAANLESILNDLKSL